MVFFKQQIFVAEASTSNCKSASPKESPFLDTSNTIKSFFFSKIWKEGNSARLNLSDGKEGKSLTF